MTTHDTIPARLAALKTMPVAELKAQWNTLFGSPAPNNSRAFLEGRLAYHIQKLAYGGLKPETIRRLERLGEELDGGDKTRRAIRLDRDRPIRVFDPTWGSGNFLVIAYKEMRAIEHEINKRRGEPGHFRADLVDDGAPLGAGGLLGLLDEGGGDEGGGDARSALAGMSTLPETASLNMNSNQVNNAYTGATANINMGNITGAVSIMTAAISNSAGINNLPRQANPQTGRWAMRAAPMPIRHQMR